MPRDQIKMKSKTSLKDKKADDRRRKQIESDSSDNDSNYNSESESEDDDIDQHEYRKFLAKMFPSKHINEKVKAGEKLKKALKKDAKKKQESEEESEELSEESDSDYVPVKKSKSKSKSRRLRRKVYESESEEDDDYETISESEDAGSEEDDYETISESEELEDDSEASSEEEEVVQKKKGKNKKQSKNFNIILSIGADKVNKEDELSEEYEAYFDDEDDEDDDDSDAPTENEDDPISSDEDSDDDDEEDEILEPVQKKKGSKSTEENVKLVTSDKSVKNNNSKAEIDLLAVLKTLQEKGENTGLVTECIKLCNQKMLVSKKKELKKLKKEKDRNDRIFRRILRDKNTMNDFEFFEKMDIESQKKIIKELREINKVTRIEKPYRLTLLESDIPVNFKGAAMKKIGTLRHMEPGSGEYYKIKNWVDTFMRIPFGKTQDLPICIEDGVDKCHEFMSEAQKTLDNAVYGLNDAKMQIMQMLGQLVTNPKSIGSAIAIHGPPGTGKTSLVKEGISKILNRPFAFIALGGATDSSFLEGHGYTYEGSMWGKIVQILIDSKCMNPVIYFDELDKISDTPKGEEIAGILTHLTDTTQNSQFHDKYFAEIDFDLSKCLFIFSYNDESKVNPILKDRMYRIKTAGYNQKQKTNISNSYLLPKIREQVKFSVEDIVIPDATLHYIIDNYCMREDGVRNMKRCLEIIYTKLNLYRLMRPGSNLFEEDMSIKVAFPFTVTRDIVDKLVKTNKDAISSALYSIYA
uniref:AAA+ ATPase domain-containing protein n=1 Tax=viral metagenome TaxID=1070528 RepID=A0A6C0I7F2_9ZZZZ